MPAIRVSVATYAGVLLGLLTSFPAASQTLSDEEICSRIRTRNGVGLYGVLPAPDGVTLERYTPPRPLTYRPEVRLFAIIEEPRQRPGGLRVVVVRTTTVATRSADSGRAANQDIYVSRGAIRNSCPNAPAFAISPSNRFTRFGAYNQAITDERGPAIANMRDGFHYNVRDAEAVPPNGTDTESPCFRTDSIANRREVFSFEWIVSPVPGIARLRGGSAVAAPVQIAGHPEPQRSMDRFASITAELVETPSHRRLCVPVTRPIPTYDGRSLFGGDRHAWAEAEAARWRPQETLIRLVDLRQGAGAHTLRDFRVRWR